MNERLIPPPQARKAILALVLATGLCAALVIARIWRTEQGTFRFFFWNLFLAWVPLLAAMPLYALRSRGDQRWWMLLPLGIVWFLFYPNAAYIITDFVHLRERTGVPLWYDIITIMACAQTGLFLGYLSLYFVQEVVRSYVGRWPSWGFALVMLWLGSFGIYVGRFLRWNSWDVIVSPIATLADAARMTTEEHQKQLLGFSVTFFAFSLVCYLIVYSFTHLHSWVERNRE